MILYNFPWIIGFWFIAWESTAANKFIRSGARYKLTESWSAIALIEINAFANIICHVLLKFLSSSSYARGEHQVGWGENVCLGEFMQMHAQKSLLWCSWSGVEDEISNSIYSPPSTSCIFSTLGLTKPANRGASDGNSEFNLNVWISMSACQISRCYPLAASPPSSLPLIWNFK